MKAILYLIIFLMISIFHFNSSGQAAPRISVPGSLKSAEGDLVSDGRYTIIFRLYESRIGGSAIWEETAEVTVSGGLYNHLLGSVNALTPALFDQTLYLGIQLGQFEQSPRTELTYAPYTFISGGARYAAKVVCSGAVGDIKYSILNPTQFAAKNGACWVPMDGTPYPNSKLATILGTAQVAPDMSGLFLRGHEYQNGNDPDRSQSSAIGTIQNDELGSHTHSAGSTSSNGAHSHTFWEINAILENVSSNVYVESAFFNGARVTEVTRTTSDVSNHTHTVTYAPAGGVETRPKNINLYAYIRID
jgi:hypothetical protein